MDKRTFSKLSHDLEAKIEMVDEFIERAHEDGISTIEAMAMQNHVRREFSPKQRTNYRMQIASLYREGKITIEQKRKMDELLNKASKIADQHFLRLSKIVPEGQGVSAPKGVPKKLLKWIGIGS